MKKIRILLVMILSVMLILSASGCMSGSKTTPVPASPAASASALTPSAAASKQSAATASASASAEPSPSAAPPSASKTPAASVSPDTGPKDFWAIADALLQSDGLGAVKISMTEGDLIKALGQPASKTEPELWGADGLQHSNWSFDKAGLKINMTKQPDESAFIVFSITASRPCDLATQRGIKLGDSKDKVLTAYADAIDTTANADTSQRIIVGSVYGGIIFSIADGAVSGIFIGAGAE